MKKAYEKLNAEYEDSEKAAKKVSGRIDKVESVSDALFGKNIRDNCASIFGYACQ